MTPCEILLVEDEKVIAKTIQETLIRLGYEVRAVATTGEEAIRKAGELRPGIVLMDIVLAGVLDGIQAAEQITRLYDIPVVYMTAHTDERTLHRASQTAPYGYVYKPVRDRELHAAIEFAIYRHAMECKLRESQHWLMATLKCISEAVVATDPHGRIRFLSFMAEALADTKHDLALGRELTHVIPLIDPATGELVENFASRFLRDEVGCTYCRFHLQRDSRRATLACSVAPIKDDRKRLLGFVLLFREAQERPRPQKPVKPPAEGEAEKPIG